MENRENHGGRPSMLHQGWGLHGLYMMDIFLACEFIMTFGWGGITTMLETVAKVGLNRSSQGTVEPVGPQEEVEELVDASTSTSDLSSPLQARKKEDNNLEYQG
jgi:hypothetical protein